MREPRSTQTVYNQRLVGKTAMNRTTVTNADGSITTTIIMGHTTHYSMLALTLVAAVLIAAGLYLLLRKKKSNISQPRM
jgi:phosphoglucomutase